MYIVLTELNCTTTAFEAVNSKKHIQMLQIDILINHSCNF